MPDTLQEHLDAFNRRRVDEGKWAARGCLLAFVGLAVAFAAGAGGCAYLASKLSPTLDFTFERPHLKPIPVPADSCPYLRSVRETAAIAGAASGDARHIGEADAWPAPALLLAQKLTTFDGALRVAATHTPGPIAQRLLEVDARVNVGVQNLPASRTGVDWENATIGEITKGYQYLQEASDLTGEACGFTVAPDMTVFFAAGVPHR